MQRHRKEMNPGCRVQDQLNTSEQPRVHYRPRIKSQKTAGRQWESNPQPSEQLQPMTIKTSTSVETATTAYDYYYYYFALYYYYYKLLLLLYYIILLFNIIIHF